MIIIIGAGISGLSVAWHLQEANVDYILLESSDKPGGYIQTIERNGCILEVGPNSILCDDETLGFINQTGARVYLKEASPVSNSRYILKNGKYKKLPDKPQSLLFSDFFSLKTKLKIFTEPFRKASQNNTSNKESLADFFTRRFGKEITDYALNPFVAGIYAGDPSDLLLEETFPVLKKYEEDYGSVLKGFIKNKPARRKSYNFEKGMAQLPITIASKLKGIRYGFKVEDIKQEGQQLVVKGQQNNGDQFQFEGQAVIVTTPAFATADFIKSMSAEIANKLQKIYYPPMYAVHSVYSKDQIQYDLNGFGALNPFIEKQFSSGCIWTSSVFPYKTPSGKFLFTSFVGGTLNSEKTLLSEDIIKENIRKELRKFFNIKGDPDFQELVKWNKAIPQYNKDLQEIKASIPLLENNNIYFCTNWLNGVSLSDCIKKGKKLAEKFINLRH